MHFTFERRRLFEAKTRSYPRRFELNFHKSARIPLPLKAYLIFALEMNLNEYYNGSTKYSKFL